jgi:hypothetical protein
VLEKNQLEEKVRDLERALHSARCSLLAVTSNPSPSQHMGLPFATPEATTHHAPPSLVGDLSSPVIADLHTSLDPPSGFSPSNTIWEMTAADTFLPAPTSELSLPSQCNSGRVAERPPDLPANRPAMEQGTLVVVPGGRSKFIGPSAMPLWLSEVSCVPTSVMSLC